MLRAPRMHLPRQSPKRVNYSIISLPISRGEYAAVFLSCKFCSAFFIRAFFLTHIGIIPVVCRNVSMQSPKDFQVAKVRCEYAFYANASQARNYEFQEMLTHSKLVLPLNFLKIGIYFLWFRMHNLTYSSFNHNTQKFFLMISTCLLS